MNLFKVFTTSIASAGSSAYFDVGTQAPTAAYMYHSTFSTAAECHVMASGDDGTTYFQPYVRNFNTATTGLSSFPISSAMTSCWVEIPVISQFFAVTTTGVVDNGATVRIACVYK